jgi:hypothetical protein
VSILPKIFSSKQALTHQPRNQENRRGMILNEVREQILMNDVLPRPEAPRNDQIGVGEKLLVSSINSSASSAACARRPPQLAHLPHAVARRNSVRSSTAAAARPSTAALARRARALAGQARAGLPWPPRPHRCGRPAPSPRPRR